ncbi:MULTISPECIES: OprD family outer membrane porin [Pseudomonas]|uniref:OprD family outer membrane porin n=1 Tax=Pseudomonas TaxID=286 RepID=UPI000281D07E|nr:MULTISPECIES: OprD family outer membrane porin [Pseudomonas]NWB69292.1 outer membrane porin, OprD family [Pseudomonas sp. I8001]QQD56497.1 OprD family outer membrane porin [Pseudomonas fluorescens BBc6R8]
MKRSTLALAVTTTILAQQALAAGFIDDSTASVSARTFYLRSDNPNTPGVDQNELTQGFKLDYLSGFTQGTVGLGLDVQAMQAFNLSGGTQHPSASTSNSLAPVDSDGTPVDSWSRLGANAKLRVSKTEFHAGSALQPNLPILVANDGRLLPQTFEGVTVTSKDIDNLTINAGQLNRSTGRASSNSTGLAIAGGTQDSNSFTYAGADWKITPTTTLQYYRADLKDYYTQDFFGLLNTTPLGENSRFKTDLRYFNSKSQGKNGTTGYLFNNNGGYASEPGKVDNTTWSAAFTYYLGGNAFMLGRQQVSDSGGTVYLNQGNVVSGAGNNEGNGGASVYLITDVMDNSFIRAGENTNFAQYSYDFAALGVPGLSASALYLHGDNIRSVDGASRYSEWERDMRIDYVVQSGPLKGFGTSLREGSFRSGIPNVGAVDQARVIFSYTYAIF